MFLWTFFKLPMSNRFKTYQTAIGCRMYSRSFVYTDFGRTLNILKQALTCRRLGGLAYICVYAGSTSPRVRHRAGLPWGRRERRARSRKSEHNGPPSVDKWAFDETILVLLYVFILFRALYRCTGVFGSGGHVFQVQDVRVL